MADGKQEINLEWPYFDIFETLLHNFENEKLFGGFLLGLHVPSLSWWQISFPLLSNFGTLLPTLYGKNLKSGHVELIEISFQSH